MQHKYTPPEVDVILFLTEEPIANDLSDHDNGYIDPWADLSEEEEDQAD